MSFDILDMTFLPALALICAATSFSDMREGRIPNSWIVAGLVWAAAVYGALSLSRPYYPELTDELVLNTLFSGSWSRLLFYTGLNALFALLCGFILFHYDLWSAGDAKLFFVLVLLLPLKYYFVHYIPGFPGFNLFLNTVVASAVFVWADTVWRIVRFARSSTEKNIWKEMAGAAGTALKNASGIFLLAGVAFSLLMFVTHYFEIGRSLSAGLTLLVMIIMLFSARHIGEVLNNAAFRRWFNAGSAVFFGALLLSSLRLQFLRLALTMSVTFLVLYFLVGILPSLAAKYEVGGGDMPFATWLSAGLLATVLIKGSFLYLILF